MPQSEILLQPKKSSFSKSLKVMKCFKYLICVLLNTEYWTAKAWLKTRRKELPGYPLLDHGSSVNLSFYLSHYYTHISKQILQYIFLLNKYLEFTKIWFSIILIQAITCMTYWFTVAKTCQRKPFYQICICSKTTCCRFHWNLVIAWSWCF